MTRWYAARNPQQMLLGSATCALGTTSIVRDEHASKPVTREAP